MSKDRSNEYRRKNYDRVSVLLEKPGRRLIDVMALREGLPKTELIRRALLARAGLRLMPYPSELTEMLEAVKTQSEARQAISRLQHHEEADDIKRHIINELSPEADQAEFQIRMDGPDVAEFRDAVRRIEKAIGFADLGTVKLTGWEVSILRRMLANIEPLYVGDDTGESTTDCCKNGRSMVE